jgi:hypothetical protein
MAMSVNPAIEDDLWLSSGHRDPAAMIRASIHGSHQGQRLDAPQQKAAHMTATGRRFHTRQKNPLPAGGHPHMTR